MAVHLFGIRHHGPGSARSLLAALEALTPDCVLIEGPPDADALIPLAADDDMAPPVALLVYQADEPRRASFYPLAAFSPEWVAMRHALAAGVPVRFMDLPQTIQLAPETPESAADALARVLPASAEPPTAALAGGMPVASPGGAPSGATPAADDQPSAARPVEDSPAALPPSDASPGATPPADDPPAAAPQNGTAGEDAPSAEPAPAEPYLRQDPLGELARVAGFTDGERWWDELVESRASRGDDVFHAVAEAMTALREAIPDAGPEAGPHAAREFKREARREAHMRTTIRAAAKEGHTRIAVVCGAWHVPALLLHDARGQAKLDAATLKGLPRVKTAVTWAPWSYERLAASSGYRAGVLSPEWYHLVWHSGDPGEGGSIAAQWLTRTARLLRDEDLDASPASVIEAVRLADMLAGMRGRSRPGLDDLQEACLGTLLFANPAPMALIHRKLIIGERLGTVPEGAPQTPVQADLAAQTRRLRLPLQAGSRPLELDLRNENDLARSRLLHRLLLLDVPWGTRQRSRGGRGTFREEWVLNWQPDHAVAVVAASRMGATVEDAAAAQVAQRAAAGGSVAALSALVGTVLDAHLPAAADSVLRALADGAALATDVFDLMDALPPLAELARYGSVRQGGAGTAGAGTVLGIVGGILTRLAAGLVAGCLSLDDEAAAKAQARLGAVQQAVALLEQPELQQEWTAALARLADQDTVNGRVVGRATRLLLDLHHFTAEQAGRRLGLALSHAAAPAEAAAWIEGFLAGSGAVLLHDAALLPILDEWLTGLTEERFVEVLPLVRRTLATFAAPERRMIGERLRSGSARVAEPDGFDEARAARVLPVLRLLLGTPA